MSNSNIKIIITLPSIDICRMTTTILSVFLTNFIYSFDLDGLIWLLTVKLICWILGFTLAIACGILAIAVGLVVSLFVYPYAIYKNVAENRVHLTEEKKAEIAGSAE